MVNEPDLLLEPGFSDKKLLEQTNKVLDSIRRRGEQFQKEFQDAQGRVTNTQAARAHARDMERLAKAYDPAYRAQVRYREELGRLERALAGRAISQQQYTKQVQIAYAEMQRASGALDVAGRSSGRFGGSLQQVGYQVGDFAVQVGAGTSAAQALGQQLPQLLGAFGTYGALAGAAAAITIPLGAALFKMAGQSQTAEEALEELTKQTDAYTGVAETAAKSISDLREEYGDLADEIQRVSGIQASFLGELAKRNLDATSGLLAGSFGGFDDTANQFTRFGLVSEADETFRRLKEELNGNEVEARKLLKALYDLSNPRGPEQIVESVAAAQKVIADFALGGGEVSKEMQGFFDDLTTLSENAADQASASVTVYERAFNEVIAKYEETTEELKTLDLARAEAGARLVDAIKDGNKEKEASLRQYLKLIDEERAKLRAAAQENDTAMQRRIQAMRSMQESQGQFGAVSGSAVDLIKEFEGFRSTPYWDVNAFRAGFGSDTVTLADGSVQRVVEGMTVSIADANRDLLRRVGEFQQSIIADIGSTRFDSFTQEQQAALTSIAYNYGSLPDRIIAAVRSGTSVDIANAIGGLAGDNGGINSDRRFKEASAFGSGSVAKEQFQATQKALKDEIKERERLADQAKKYGEQLSANLLTQQQTAELERQRSEQIAAIKAQGLGEDEEARAISGVNAEIEKQRTILSLLAEAKKRNVDLDTLLANGSMTYRQAIEALGEAKRQDIIATNERAIAEGKAGQAQQFWKQQQEQTKNGLLDAIVAGESFADVLENLAQQFAKAALQAALFNEGPWAMGGSGGGLLSGIGDLVSSWFGGFRAGGGSVSPGRAYVVGETEPELFVPNVTGTVLNSRQIERAMGAAPRQGGNSQYSLAMTVDLRGTSGDKVLDQKLEASARAILAQVPNAMREFELNGV